MLVTNPSDCVNNKVKQRHLDFFRCLWTLRNRVPPVLELHFAHRLIQFLQALFIYTVGYLPKVLPPWSPSSRLWVFRDQELDELDFIHANLRQPYVGNRYFGNLEIHGLTPNVAKLGDCESKKSLENWSPHTIKTAWEELNQRKALTIHIAIQEIFDDQLRQSDLNAGPYFDTVCLNIFHSAGRTLLVITGGCNFETLIPRIENHNQ